MDAENEQSAIANWSLPMTNVDAESRRASLEAVLSQIAIEDEDKERRRRERAVAAMRSASSTMHSDRGDRGMRRHLFTMHADGTMIDDDTQDSAKSDGVSLALGSREHRDYVRDREGMDTFEQERASLAEIGFGTKGDTEAPGPDEFHDERYEELSQQDEETSDTNEQQYEAGDDARGRIMHDHVVKHVQADRIYAMANSIADSTPGLDDDHFAEDVLPGVLKSKVHDISVSSLAQDEARVIKDMSDLSFG